MPARNHEDHFEVKSAFGFFFFCPPFMFEDVLTPKAFMVALVIE